MSPSEKKITVALTPAVRQLGSVFAQFSPSPPRPSLPHSPRPSSPPERPSCSTASTSSRFVRRMGCTRDESGNMLRWSQGIAPCARKYQCLLCLLSAARPPLSLMSPRLVTWLSSLHFHLPRAFGPSL